MRPTKTTHIFEVAQKSVKFSSNFDSGNLRSVTQTALNEFLIESSIDSYDQQVSSKSFFHFFVENYPTNTEIILTLPCLSLLQCIPKDDVKEYRPFYSVNGGSHYDRLPSECVEVKLFANKQIPQLQIKYKFVQNISMVYFAFALPYPYERYLNMVRDLPDSNQQFYLQKEVLCYSNNLNLVYMISISSYDQITDEYQHIGEQSNGIILPEKDLKEKKKYFDKPVILISGRVHPGETPSSWAIEGILKYLIGGSEEAVLLRKYFQIIIIPMLNPDGVYEGLYRLDTKGHNLNRYYLISDNRQPSIYSMKHLIRHYNETKRLLYYFDFHGHPSQKGSFLYGNAIDQIAYQAETELFARLLAIRCKTFQEKFCIFEREQMNSKDKYDMYTKEGCARVYAFKASNILHSYTVEMGFHSVSSQQQLQGTELETKQLQGTKTNEFQGTKTNELQGTKANQQQSMKTNMFYYNKDSYYQEGVAILKTILESAGLKQSFNVKRNQLRKIIANQINARDDRFRKEDKMVMQKKNNVNQIIQNQYWKPIYARFFKQNNSFKKQSHLNYNLKVKNQQQLRWKKKITAIQTHQVILTTINQDSLIKINPQSQDYLERREHFYEEINRELKPTIVEILQHNLKFKQNRQENKKLERTSIAFSVDNKQNRTKNKQVSSQLSNNKKTVRINVKSTTKNINSDGNKAKDKSLLQNLNLTQQTSTKIEWKQSKLRELKTTMNKKRDEKHEHWSLNRTLVKEEESMFSDINLRAEEKIPHISSMNNNLLSIKSTELTQNKGARINQFTDIFGKAEKQHHNHQTFNQKNHIHTLFIHDSDTAIKNTQKINSAISNYFSSHKV